MKNRMFAQWLSGIAAVLVSGIAAAQGSIEISFYYPVAVGGPITRIIDGLAADFEKENAGNKVRPIYSGSYHESITKALTAVKSDDAPTMSVVLPTDMYNSTDEDTIIPLDCLI